MTKQEKEQLAHWVITQAKKAGAQEVSVIISEGRSSEVIILEEKIDQLKENINLSLGVDLYVDQRFSSHSTNRLDRVELEHFIHEAVASTRYLSVDTYRQLPDSKLYYKGNGCDLHNYDTNFNNITAEEKIELAKTLEKEIIGTDPRIISIECSYSDSINESLLVNSNGFEGFRKKSSFCLSTSVAVKGNEDSRPSDYDYDSNTYFDQLKKKNISSNALARTLRKIDQQKIHSGKFTMIVENRVASQLLSPLISALNGSAIQQKNSFLIGKKNEQVASPLLHLIDDPFILSSSASRHYDYEGLAMQTRIIFNNGKVETYYIDSYYARKLGVEPTSGQTTNLIMSLGNRDQIQMIDSEDRVILVTGFNGGNCNSSTGDFSYGIEGYLYEKGKLITPLSEMNITGNMLELWLSLKEVGNDPKENTSWRIPSLMFDLVNFSGL